jgi:PKD repeat protein
LNNCSNYFTYSSTGNAGFNFNPNTNVPPQWILSYFWSFGDGTSSTNAYTSHTFGGNGSYVVTLTTYAYYPADTTQNCTSTSSQTITVSNANCNLQASVSASPDTANSLNYTIIPSILNGSAYAAGYLTIGPNGQGFNTTDTVNYIFPGAGTYTVCYYVQDSSMLGQLCTDSACIIVTTNGNTATCNAYFSGYAINSGAYAFNAGGNFPPSWPVSYIWDFGDNTSGSGSNQTHTYQSNGTYTVWLTTYAVNPSDSTQYCSATYSQTITVNNANGTNCSVGISSTYNGNGNYSFGAVANTSYTTYQSYTSWTVDGISAGSNNDTLNYTFTTNGNHYVCVQQMFINSNAFSDTCFTSNCVQVSWYNSNNGSCQASYVLFQDSLNPTVYYGYNNSTGNNLTYFWDFGDGTTSTQAFPAHTYSVTGYYTICLTVTDSAANCTSTYCDTAGVYRVASSGGISSVTILGTNVGIDEEEEISNMNIVVAPNPVTDQTTLNIESLKSGKITLTITSVLGQMISNESLNLSEGKNSIRLSTENLTSGIYFLSLSQKDKLIKTIKLVK